MPQIPGRRHLKRAASKPGQGRRRNRFVAPARADVSPDTFAHPAFAEFLRYQDLLSAPDWPDLADLNARGGGASPRFIAQTPMMLADGLHYETRIAELNQIATRAGNWHDLLNALVWLRFPALKRALNGRQTADIARVGPRERTRGQCALTLFDEGGIIVIARDLRLLEAWDRHDWPCLFGAHAAIWQQAARVLVFGHALLEHALDPEHLLVGKALVIATHADPRNPQVERDAIAQIAEAIAAGKLLLDPKELRALPLSGLAHWHRSSRNAVERAEFLQSGECFRPLAAGRHYPGPLWLPTSAAVGSKDTPAATIQPARAHG